MKKRNTILWGIVLVIAGVFLALNSLELIDFNIFFDGWWTLFIIVPCFIGIFTDANKFSNFIGLCVGVVLLLYFQNFISWDLISKLIAPFIIVVVGIKLIFNALRVKKSTPVVEPVSAKGGAMPSAFAAFSGQDVKFDNETFTGGEYCAIFGGIKLDLANAIIPSDCVIKTTAIFGGIDIFVPDNVNVKINSASIFGGMADKKQNRASDTNVTLYVQGFCMFGGVDVK